MLAAGIDVISTVNVQHLESLNDAIAELTDVRVRETFPDSRARRRRRGRARRPDAARRSRSGCAPGRSTRPTASTSRWTTSSAPTASRALRELALREVAEDVEARRQAAVLDPLSATGGRRACARARHAGAALAADPAARLALGASGSARRSTRSGCTAPGRELTRGGAGPARRAAPARRHPRRALPRGGGRRPGRDRARASSASAARPTCSSARPTSAAAREILRGSLVSALVRELPGVDIRVVANRADRERRRMTPSSSSLALVVVLVGAIVPSPRRGVRHAGARAAILVPFSGALDPTVLDAAIRIARARGRGARAGLPARRPAAVRGGLAAQGAGRRSPCRCSRRSSTRRSARAFRSTRGSRRAASLTHALRRLWEVEHFDRIVAPRRRAGSPPRNWPGSSRTRRRRRSCSGPPLPQWRRSGTVEACAPWSALRCLRSRLRYRLSRRPLPGCAGTSRSGRSCLSVGSGHRATGRRRTSR